MRRLVLCLGLAAAAGSAAKGQSPGFPGVPGGARPQPEPAKQVTATAIASHLAAAPGGGFHVAVVLDIADGWVFYSPDPGPVVLPGRLEVSAPGLDAGEPLWPQDKQKTTPAGPEPIVNNVYTHRAVVYIPVTVPPGAAEGPRQITVTAAGQICARVCMSLEGVRAETTIQVGAHSQPNPAWSDAFPAGLAEAMTADELMARHRSLTGATAAQAADRPSAMPISVAGIEVSGMSFWAGLGLALLAGLTLNIMPCVLPVIPLRVLSVVAMARESRRRFVTLGLAFAGGIMLFFIALAAVNASLRLASGQAVNVSDHFTYPAVRIAMALVLVALSANLLGAFSVVPPSRLAAAEGPRAEGHLRSAGMGFMMAVLATPCSFAYLLAAMAWAQIQPLWLGTLAIVLMGAGMASPHVLLCAFPGLLKRLPRAGRWTELFRQAMGFLLLPVAIWLISTLGTQTRPFWVAAYGVVLAFSLWMWGSWLRYDAPLGRRLLVGGLAVAVAVGGGVLMLPQRQPLATRFEAFDEGLIAQARWQGRIALVKVTASWCTECIVVDGRVYDRPEVARLLSGRGVLAIKADVTDRSSPASAWVRTRFVGAPPLTIIYPASSAPPRVLVGAFSKDDLLKALDQAGGD